MLTSAASSASPLTSVPLGLDDALQVCGTRKKKAPASPTTAGATPSSPSTGGVAKPTRPTTGTKPRAATPATRTSGSGYAKPAATATAAASRSAPAAGAQKPGPLAFLDDPKLSMEEKLLKLLAYLNDKWNKELDRKMKEFKTSSKEGAASGGSGGSSGGLGGLVKKAVSFASTAMPVLGFSLEALKNPAVRSVARSIAGPALAAAATAAGQPQLAPVALKLGPDLVDLAASAAPSGGGSSPTAGAGSSSGATKETAEGIGSDKDAQLKLMEMQRIIDQQKEMFSLVSNLLRATHETRMSVIQNVR